VKIASLFPERPHFPARLVLLSLLLIVYTPGAPSAK
jgi:hypothetical protein